MKKRLITLLSALALLGSPALLLPASAKALPSAGSLDNFRPVRTFSSGQFWDVAGEAWYAMYVQADFEYGLAAGRTGAEFDPYKALTKAEAVKLAVCLRSTFYSDGAHFSETSPWYASYADYALKNGLIDTPLTDGNKPITRAAFAELIAKALPPSAFPSISSVADGAIPDVSDADSFSGAVKELYRAGVLVGGDGLGNFQPFRAVTRAEAAAVTARVSSAGFRVSFRMPSLLTGESLYEKCDPAVFYLERYDSQGNLLGIGSGFFISRDGLAVTNYHVIKDAASASITTADGSVYPVAGICGYDTARDLAILKINGGSFSFLSLANSNTLGIGDSVYAIGSPLKMNNTISSGIVSKVAVPLGGYNYIQFSAPISMGSGGGPLLNAYGQVVGVSCLTTASGQLINFAVPSNDILSLSRSGCVPLISIIAKNANSLTYYSQYFPVPDYGVFVGAPIYKTKEDVTRGVKTFFYQLSAITVPDETAVDGYISALTQSGFTWNYAYTNSNGYKVDAYRNDAYDMTVLFGIDKVDGVECRFVAVY